ncbi:MAG: type III-B CRISPR module RAMP protein Cmr1, partial [Armatimonadota bacterium]
MSYRPLSLTVTLKTITPLLLGGSNGRDEPDLRPPSFRGALRYWLRAALGGVVGDKDISTLRELESAVFGSTDHGSPVRVRLSCFHGQPRTEVVSILPHMSGVSAGRRKAFAAGQKFDLIMSENGKHEECVWNAACSALMLALTFGGVGLRSRRGYGTLDVVDSSNPELV